jgi:hypothetical protein
MIRSEAELSGAQHSEAEQSTAQQTKP